MSCFVPVSSDSELEEGTDLAEVSQQVDEREDDDLIGVRDGYNGMLPEGLLHGLHGDCRHPWSSRRVRHARRRHYVEGESSERWTQ